jgi:hypothetical protein
VTTKRSQRPGKAEAPITGVASGYLGTGTNLDDTQLLETADLEAAAAAAPVDVPAAPPIEKPPVERVVRQRPTARARPASGTGRLPVLVGVAAFVVLLLFAGVGFFSQLDLGVAGPAATVPVAEAATQPPPTATPQPQRKDGSGKGHDGCHGRHCGD